MSELPGRSDDLFAQLVDQLGKDDAFVDAMSAANEDMDELAAVAAAPRLTVEGESRPYYTEPLTDVGEDIHREFLALCAEHSIDPNTAMAEFADLNDVAQEIALLVYAMKDRLWLGDTIAASRALVLDLGDEDDEGMISVTSIAEDHTLVGAFGGPVIGPLPDEALALTGDGDAPIPIGVGLRLEHPALMDASGELDLDVFDGDVVVALGTIGLKLERLRFFDQQDD